MREESPPIADQIETELNKKLFHLKTLYDVSRELIGMDNIDAIMHIFLMMSTGNFGILQGFMQLYDRNAGVAEKMESVGIGDKERSSIDQVGGRLLAKDAYQDEGIIRIKARHKGILPDFIEQALIFNINHTCTAILGLGPKIMGDPFSDEDLDLLETLVNNLIAALKNAMAAEALKDAYAEVSSLNRAKDKVINHLSHELKTPIALLGGSLELLKRSLAQVPGKKWQRTVERAQRSLGRLSDLQQEAADIMQTGAYESRRLICCLLDQCTDELESLVAQEAGEGAVTERVRQRIDAIFDVQPNIPEEIDMAHFVRSAIKDARAAFAHRDLHFEFEEQASPKITMPGAVLAKVVLGLVKNAVENTPDGSNIRVAVTPDKRGAALEVRDFGVGILPDHKARIFEGFHPTQQTAAYSSKRPFEFNAGGKGADLLRMKIFSERFGFSLDFSSQRCRHLPTSADICPGAVDRCQFCKGPEDCFASGGSSFRVVFPTDSIS